MIAAPCFAGQMHVGFFRTCIDIQAKCTELDIDYDFLVTEGESLVTRARNNIVATFLRTDFEVLAFIDADIEMSGEDFIKLYELEGVRGAAVAMKHPNIESLSCFKDGKQVSRGTMPSEPFTVDFLGSAVLLIPRIAFEELKESEEVSRYEDPIVGEAWDFFQTGVVDDVYMSEDYGFCLLCKEQAFQITCHPEVVVKHYGSTFWQH